MAMIRFTTFIWPSNYGWKAEHKCNLTSAKRKSSDQKLLMKIGSRSLTIDYGIPRIQSDNLIEIGPSNWPGGVKMSQSNKVSIFGEVVDQQENHWLAIDRRMTIDKIHWNICLNRMRHIEKLKQASWVEMLYFVALIDIHALITIWIMERGTQAMQRLLNSFMAGIVTICQKLWPQRWGGWQVDVALVHYKVIH